MEDLHGTDGQWSRAKQRAEDTKGHVPPDGEPESDQVCPHCYTRNAEYAEFCNHCGRELKAKQWQSSPPPASEYQPYRVYPPVENYGPDERIGEASVGDLAAIVGNNTRYYLPRFRNVAQNGRAGWNWAAFLLGPLWLIYRKQYAIGFFLLILETVMNLASAVLSYPINSATTEAEALQMMEQMQQNPMFPFLFLLVMILVGVRVILGLRGTDLYLNGCYRKIRKAKEKISDISSAELATKGGVSIGIVILCYFATNTLVNLFVMMLFS